ncbi:MAG: hypothetical protein IJ594_02460 [Oscillospiraceae bacterium]|nr:hypothetical protein [Oscillospiraceae bacterium]
MIVLYVLLALAAFLVISYFVAKEFYKAAVARGWPHKKYFWLCFLLPPAGYLLVVALPDRGGPALGSFVSDDLPEL